MKDKVVKVLKVGLLSILINWGIVAVMVELWIMLGLQVIQFHDYLRRTFDINIALELEVFVIAVIAGLISYYFARKLFKLKWPWLIPMIPMDYALAWAVMIARMILFPISW